MARVVLAFAAYSWHAAALAFERAAHSRESKCVVWHSQHKAAGATFEDILSEVALKDTGITGWDWRRTNSGKYICDKETWSCKSEKCLEGSEFASYKGYKIAIRGYVQVLAGSPEWGPAGGGHCIWATMFREPVARLVSAYMYCKNGWHHDPLCGFHRLAPQNTSGLQDFSEHWGNFAFRELLWFPELHAIAESRSDYKRGKHCRVLKNGRSLAPRRHKDLRDPWVTFKDHLNGGDTLTTASGRKNFEKVQDYLFGRSGVKQLYDVIGVVERFDESLRLFEKIIPLGFSRGWQEEVQKRGHGQSHGSEDWKEEENALLAEARRSPQILGSIAADMKLYDDVLRRFANQLDEHNVARQESKGVALLSGRTVKVK